MPVTEADFRTAVLPFTLKQEGGLSLDKNDPGNWTSGKVGKGTLKGTKYGIAANSHPTLDIQHLTLDQACDIYWVEYCRGPGFDKLNLPLLQVVFDAGVNCGPARARAWLATAAAKATEREQIVAFSALNLAYHKKLATWGRYGKTWGTRIAACQTHALLLLAAAPAPIAPKVAPPRIEVAPTAPKAATQRPAGFLALLLRSLAVALTPAPAQPQRA